MKIDEIMINVNIDDIDGLFTYIAEKWQELGYVNDANKFKEGLYLREGETSTGFVDGFAIPHSKNSSVIKPGVMYLSLENAIAWDTFDGNDIKYVFTLAIPEDDSENVHLKNLALISRKLVNEQFRNNIKDINSAEELLELLR